MAAITATLTLTLTVPIIKQILIGDYHPETTDIYKLIDDNMPAIPFMYIYTYTDFTTKELRNFDQSALREKWDYLIIRNVFNKEDDIPIPLTWTTEISSPDDKLKQILKPKSKLASTFIIDNDITITYEDPRSPMPNYE